MGRAKNRQDQDTIILFFFQEKYFHSFSSRPTFFIKRARNLSLLDITLVVGQPLLVPLVELGKVRRSQRDVALLGTAAFTRGGGGRVIAPTIAD